jgi:predicted ATP-grasp superfamily ATP-dependent carboligase
MWPDHRPFLIVSASGRSLAAMATRSGARSVVLDLFADQDTATHCDAVRRVTSDRALRFHGPRLLRAAATLAPQDTSAGLVVGSGLEGRPCLLGRLATGRRLFGNPPRTIARLKELKTLLPLLESLDIRYPAVSLEAPLAARGWLVKQAGGSGGTHVRRARTASKPRAGRYFQRYVDGRSLSVAFLANGRDARIVGFNHQWPAGASCPDSPFAYGGASSDAGVPAVAKAEVESWVYRLTAAAGLVGLNGIDFLLDEGDMPWFLEVNPRPTATGELYDERAPGGLFRWHVQACGGALPMDALDTGDARGHQVVYAGAALEVPARLHWPTWVTDRPAPGTFLVGGAPVCTVHADGSSAYEVERRLDERSRTIVRSIVPLAA